MKAIITALVAILAAGCGPQPWTATATDALYSEFLNQGASISQASCLVIEVQKRMSEHDFQRRILQANVDGQLGADTAALMTEAGTACRGK